MVYGEHTKFLFRRYRDVLGGWRYRLLLNAQALLVAPTVRRVLRLPEKPALALVLPIFSLLNALHLRAIAQRVLVPNAYLAQVRQLDRRPG